MSGTVTLIQPQGTRIPADLPDLAAFRHWTRSEGFPESGRIDWIGGEVEIDLFPESLNSHATPKMAVGRDLSALVEGLDLGIVVTDSTRYVCDDANLSAEPDVVVLLFESVESGRAILVRRKTPGSADYVELEGAADVVVEIVSDSSEEKDTMKLPARYHAAGVREYWILDARGDDPSFTLNLHAPGGYRPVEPDADGFRRSLVLARSVRLVRLPERAGMVRYRLESRL